MVRCLPKGRLPLAGRNETVHGYPGFASAAERAAFMVRHHRFPELSFDELTPDERRAVVVGLRRELGVARRHAIVAHVRGIVLTVCFLAIGLLLFGVGPAFHISFFPGFSRTAFVSGSTLWVALVLTAVVGAEAVDYVLRHRLKVARMWEREAREIHHAISRASAAADSAAR